MGRLTRFTFATLLLGMTHVYANITPVAVMAQPASGYPAYVIARSCADPWADVYLLTGVGAMLTATGTPVPDVERLGAANAIPLLTSATVLEGASITTLTDEPHAIAIYASDESPDQMVACGAIGGILTRQMTGMIMPGDILNVGLGSLEDSGPTGIASLQSVEGGNMQITILLATDADGMFP